MLYITCCACLFIFFSANAQVKSPDSLRVTDLLHRADVLTQHASYDSATALARDGLHIAAVARYKPGEAASYDRISEVMLATGKWSDLQKNDSVAFSLITQLKDTGLYINYWNRSGIYCTEQGKYADAEKNFNLALTYGLEKQQSQKTAEVYSNLASMYLAKADKERASEWFFKALRLYEKTNNEKGQGETYSNISSLFYLMGKTDEAIDYQKKSIAIRERLNDLPGLAITHVNIGQLYILKGDYQQALPHLQQSVKYAEQINNPKIRAGAYSGMSAYYNRTKDFKAALLWQSKAIPLFEQTDNFQLLSRLYVAAGNLANVTGDSIASVNYYMKALALATRLDNKENIGNAYEKLSSFYTSHNDFKNAYDNYKKFISFRDTIAATSTTAKIEEIKTRYETEKKDNEISRLNTDQKIKSLQIEKQQALLAGNKAEAEKKQNEIELLSKEKELQDLKIKQQGESLEKQVLLARTGQQQLELAEKEKTLKEKEIQNQKQVRNLLLGGLVLIILLGAILFNRYQLKKKLEQQKGLLNMRNSISQDLHDDIGASLSNINILNELAKRNLAQPEKSKDYLSRASEDIQRISESLSDIVWNINPKYDDAESLFIRMKRYGADMFDGKNINGSFELPLPGSTLNLSMTQRRDLYLIFKEAVNNLAKYSGAKNALVKITSDNTVVHLLVKDDGNGFDEASLKTGNGLRNMRQRAEASGADISIHSSPGKGTSISLQMKHT
ncbi:MAG: DUF2225 domain-containing protein [Chitinophagaceae bacterium]